MLKNRDSPLPKTGFRLKKLLSIGNFNNKIPSWTLKYLDFLANEVTFQWRSTSIFSNFLLLSLFWGSKFCSFPAISLLFRTDQLSWNWGWAWQKHRLYWTLHSVKLNLVFHHYFLIYSPSISEVMGHIIKQNMNISILGSNHRLMTRLESFCRKNILIKLLI
jgi:hypothetical protein